MDRYRREVNFTRSLRLKTPLSLGLLVFLLVTHTLASMMDMVLQVADRRVVPAILHGANIDFLVWEGQWWRLISATFLHGGWLHLVFNAYALYVLGPVLERLYGSRRFVVLYVGAGLLASLASLWLTGRSVGASGAIFGLLGALMAFGLRHRQKLPPKVGKAFGVGMLPWVVINIGIGFIPGLQIDNAAHIGGLIAGALLALPMSTTLEAEPLRWRRAGLEVLFLVSMLLVSWGLVGMLHQAMRCTSSVQIAMVCYPLDKIQPEQTPDQPEP